MAVHLFQSLKETVQLPFLLDQLHSCSLLYPTTYRNLREANPWLTVSGVKGEKVSCKWLRWGRQKSVPFASWEISSPTTYTPCHSNLNSTVHLWSVSVVSFCAILTKMTCILSLLAVLSIRSLAVELRRCVVSTGGTPTTFGFSLWYRDLDRHIPVFIQESLAVMEIRGATAVQCDKTWPHIKSLSTSPPLAC